MQYNAGAECETKSTNAVSTSSRQSPVGQLLNTQIEPMLKDGIIEESTSPWSVQILIAPKPDGTGRLCVDFRRLNSVTEADLFPMPRVDTLLDRLQRARFINTIYKT